jgi:hypothetical protein
MSKQFTSEKHANSIHILGFCNGNALALLKECRLYFSSHYYLRSMIFSGVYQLLLDTNWCNQQSFSSYIVQTKSSSTHLIKKINFISLKLDLSKITSITQIKTPN